jgi:hypothetical protein
MPDTLLACNILHAALDADVRGLDVVSATRQSQVEAYLDGGNTKAWKVITRGGIHGYLYLLHEAIELEELAKWTPPPASPSKGLIRRNGIQVASAATGAGTPKPPQPVVAKADAKARACEIRAERTFARLALGEDVGIDALVASTTTLPAISPTPEDTSAAALNDPLVRANAAKVLGCGTSVSPEETAAAGTLRQRLYGVDLAALRALGPIARLAYSMWEVRGHHHGDDWFDWFEAEKALRAL